MKSRIFHSLLFRREEQPSKIRPRLPGDNADLGRKGITDQLNIAGVSEFDVHGVPVRLSGFRYPIDRHRVRRLIRRSR